MSVKDVPIMILVSTCAVWYRFISFTLALKVID